MKVLFIVPYPKGVAASQRFRVEQLLPLLDQQNVSYKLASFWGKEAYTVLYKPGQVWRKAWGLLKGFSKRVLHLTELPRYDYIFIHREATPIGPPWFEWLASKMFRKKVIFDMDDALWLPNTTDHNRLAAKFKQHHKVERIIKWSHKVSCGNSFLAQYAARFNANVVLLPTTVDTTSHFTQLKQQQTEPVVIGWTGSHSTLPFLKMLEPVLLKLEEEFKFDFIVIADKEPDLKLKSLVFIPWQRKTEIQDLLKMNIGIMPLPATEWAEGKCAFKAIQYMALGIPAVVAAVGANLSAVPDGVAGFVCHTDEDWYLHLKELIQKAELRSGLGMNGRKWVEQHYSVRAYEATFLNLFI